MSETVEFLFSAEPKIWGIWHWEFTRSYCIEFGYVQIFFSKFMKRFQEIFKTGYLGPELCKDYLLLVLLPSPVLPCFHASFCLVLWWAKWTERPTGPPEKWFPSTSCTWKYSLSFLLLCVLGFFKVKLFKVWPNMFQKISTITI